MSLIEQIKKDNVPSHVAIIMDGNGRWAKQQGKIRVFGHNEGVESVNNVLDAADDIGVRYLTLYTFSVENWNRPKFEVSFIMKLLVRSLKKQLPRYMKKNVRLEAIGNLDLLPSYAKKTLLECVDIAKDNTGLTLVIALSYSSRMEIANAAKQIAIAVKQGEIDPEDIDTELFGKHLYTANYPDPELLIRTSGEYRISNYLLWQIAYSELYFSDKYWPEFRREDLFAAVIDYQKRERRFGKTSEQIKK